jgi:hypothetical protein
MNTLLLTTHLLLNIRTNTHMMEPIDVFMKENLVTLLLCDTYVFNILQSFSTFHTHTQKRKKHVT